MQVFADVFHGLLFRDRHYISCFLRWWRVSPAKRAIEDVFHQPCWDAIRARTFQKLSNESFIYTEWAGTSKFGADERWPSCSGANSVGRGLKVLTGVKKGLADSISRVQTVRSRPHTVEISQVSLFLSKALLNLNDIMASNFLCLSVIT